MSEYAIPAIVFRTDKPLKGSDDVKALMTDIKMHCRNWVGTSEYQAVLNFEVDKRTRKYVEVGATVPYDPDAMDRVLLAIPELTSVKRYHQLDMIDMIDSGKRQKSGMKPPKPKPDPAIFPHGWDITKLAVGLQHMHEPEARAEARRFAELLNGYPFTDKTPRENQTFIEMEVIAILEEQFPHINAVDIYLSGAVVKELRIIANPDNQPNLGDSVTYFRCQFTNHPSTFASLCKSATSHLASEKRKAQGVSAPKIKPEGIAARYSELMLDQEMDYITSISAGTNDAVHRDDLSDAAKERLKRKQSANSSPVSA
jgi:hypothetical protein